jgi:hypothetical protein
VRFFERHRAAYREARVFARIAPEPRLRRALLERRDAISAEIDAMAVELLAAGAGGLQPPAGGAPPSAGGSCAGPDSAVSSL